MKIQPECYPCALSQVLEAARRVNLDTDIEYELLRNTMEQILNISPETTMPEVGQLFHRMVREHSDNQDPYRREKVEFNARLLELLPAIRREVQNSNDPLRTAIRYAIAGNVIDFATTRNGQIDLQKELDGAASNPFHLDHFTEFKQSLRQASSIVYLADNAGEIVMDRLLIEVIKEKYGKDIIVVVRGAPVLNDATLSDAHQIRLDDIATVLSNGNDAPGTLYEELTPEVKALLDNADMIIAKGQGNYESLSGYPLPIYFLFKVKCQVVAEKLTAPENSYILANSQSLLKKD